MIEMNPREIAAQAMEEIMEDGAYNNMTLRRLLKQNGAMPTKDRALVTEIVNGSLRNLYFIDHVISQVSSVKLHKMKPWILAILRTAIYQMYFMKIPDSAACNEAVNLAQLRGLADLKGFVNGVLRSAGRKKDNIALPPKDTAEYLHLQYSHPLWLVKMWIAYYGFEETEALCKQNNQSPDVSIRVNTLKTNAETLQAMLEQEGVQVKAGLFSKNALHLKGTADLGRSKGFREGLFHVQDESSQLAVALLAPKKGQRVLDLCAAPGGKSFTIAQCMENQGELIAGDIFEHKIELMEDGANRLGISMMECKLQDGTEVQQAYVNRFDAVLVDAPCSGLGLMGKKPDIRLKKSGEEIDSLIGIQREILQAAQSYVKTGGTLLYSTCTLSRKENEKNVEWFLKEYPDFVSVDITKEVPTPLYNDTAKNGYVTILPHVSKTDGFFVAKLQKKG